MKPYRVILSGASVVKIDRARWAESGWELNVRDEYQTHRDTRAQRHFGLIYRCDLQAADARAAMTAAVAVARKVSDELAVFHQAAIAVPSVRIAISMEDGDQRDLAQAIYEVPNFYLPKRAHDKALYRRVFESLRDRRHSRPKEAKRVERAMHYLRSSYLELDPIDRFEDAWVALEALNPLIRDKHKLPTTYQGKCSDCGAPTGQPNSTPALEYLLGTLLKLDATTIRQVRGKRIDIVHARENADTVVDGIDNATVIAQRAVLAGIYDVLDLTPESSVLALKRPLTLPTMPNLTINARIRGLTLDAMRQHGSYPQLKLLGIETMVNEDDPYVEEVLPVAFQALVEMHDFDGEWDLLGGDMPVDVDPDSESLPMQLLFQKMHRPRPAATAEPAIE